MVEYYVTCSYKLICNLNCLLISCACFISSTPHQFDPETLDAVLYLMDMSVVLDSDGRRNPITVARAMTEMVNQEDNDGGILYGLWSDKDEDYADGTDPTAWSGSAAILREFLDTKKPVRYAQCWVFGGTLTTGPLV